MTEKKGFDFFLQNQSMLDRQVRFVISIIGFPLAYYLYDENTMLANVIAVVSFVLLYNALSGTCNIYRMFDYSTCEIKE